MLFLQFLKLGLIAFGGPAAHAGLMERELVARKKWISAQTLLDFLGAVNLIPGPNSTQLTMLVGYRFQGFWGLLVSGGGFILPAALITGVLAWAYVSMGSIPAVGHILFGLKPAILAIIAGAIFQLGKKALKNAWLALMGAAALLALWFGLGEVPVILGAGAVGMVSRMLQLARTRYGKKKHGAAGAQKNSPKNKRLWIFPLLPLSQAVIVAAAQTASLKLFWIFFKIGALLFGSGYLLVAYMDAELVDRLGLLTRAQLLDAIAIGQFTPGPILTAATFVGYQLEGIQGAVAATLGIFLPSVFFILLLYPLIPRLRRSPITSAFLDSVNMAAVCVMLWVSIYMAIEVTVDWRSASILALSLIAVFWIRRISSVWIVLSGALTGYLLQLVFPS